jgi:integrase/recombinase XerD
MSGTRSMANLKLPHVNSFYDRHGRLRHQFRRKGYKKQSLPGLPGSAEFMDAYQLLIEQTGGGAQRVDVGANRTKAGTINALIISYYKSAAFTEALASETQRTRRNILERFRADHGDKRAAFLQHGHIHKILEEKKRYAKRNWLKTIRVLMAFAIAEGIRADNPCIGVELPKAPKSMGHMTWLEPQIAMYRERHKLGTVARLALELLLNIAARRYDAHVLGRQHIIISNKDGKKKLCWRPHKTLRSTAKMLKITIIPSLQTALDAMPKSETTFLTTDSGRPFASAAAFGNKFADWCKAAGLKPVLCDDGRTRSFRAHGLRKSSLRAMAHAGCTGVEMMQVSGHSSLKQLQEYLDEVEQEQMADSAMEKLVRDQNGNIE